MRHAIHIDYSPQKMESSRRRMEALGDRRYVDRAAVLYCLVPRYFAPLFGLRYIDFFKDVETHYYWQLQFAKYRIENIPEDSCGGPTIHVHPYFDNVVPPSAQGARIGWVEDGPPRAIPVIHTVEQMERFEVARPDAALRGKTIQWWHQMQDLAAQTQVTFGRTPGRVDVGVLGMGGLSPHMLAIDLVGEDFYWWMLEYPQPCHRFLQKLMQGEILAEELCRTVDPRPRSGYSLAEDSAQVMSPDLFREFCVPYSAAMFDRLGAGMKFGRGLHMCGNSAHLLGILRDELKITSFDVFGYLVPPKVAAQALGGRCQLWGNLNPMLLQTGSKAQVKAAAMECLDALGPCGGFVLGDGANVCPGTPLESFRAVMEAAEEFGLGNGRLPQ